MWRQLINVILVLLVVVVVGLLELLLHRTLLYIYVRQ